MEMINVTDTWKNAYPGAVVGVMVIENITNPESHPELQKQKTELQERLRAQYKGYDRAALRALPVLQAYHQYYKLFKKTYHLQLQLESVVLKNKPIPSVAALVEAMFMTELDTLLLMAGHDMDTVKTPLEIDISKEGEHFTQLGGNRQELKPGDMIMRDAESVICSVIYGSDHRTRLTPQTQRILFVVYAPPGISEAAVRKHFELTQENIRVFEPGAEVTILEVYKTIE